ncbi:hypothetical protein JCGZ_13714 [Jatropha curcas]|uniref:Uncharacterized protein n=1 Tax=Jatropha curcas TaxID=180498 RepID=A0A067LPW7_JATCU|nr:hypothetical protein JCGZ_13714 [Jatropha curcas]
MARGALNGPNERLGPAQDGPSTGVEEEGLVVGLLFGVLAKGPEAREEVASRGWEGADL